MKNFLILLFSLSLLVSCSTDEINRDDDFIGVWEQKDFEVDSGYRLVFSADHSGIHIYKKVDDGGVTSSAIEINWERIGDNSITISEGFGSLEAITLTINSNGQLALNNNQEVLPFDKISDTTLDY